MVQAAKDKPHKSAVGLYGCHTIYGADGEHDTPYMTRAWFGRLRIHIFHRGDADPDCHDHPWDFWTFPLTSYVEEVTEPSVGKSVAGYFASDRKQFRICYRVRRQVVRAFRVTYRPATHCHRVLGRVAKDGSFTGSSGPNGDFILVSNTDARRIIIIVWRGGIGRKWGFLRNRDGHWCWTPWKEYVFGGGKDAPCSDAEGGRGPQ